MKKKTVAKVIGWLGGVLVTLATSGALGKYSGIGSSAGALFLSVSIGFASETSAGHPNGLNS